MHVDTITTHAVRAVSRLRRDLAGSVITPDDAGYDDARAVFYGSIDRRPAAVARPRDARDVGRIVTFAQEEGLELAVRSGGHSVAGHSATDGGIVLDLSDMRLLEIDRDERTAWAETGLTAGAYTAAVGAHGLATGFGDAPSVGIGGITLGGGVGFLHRKHGLTIDSLLAADVVTADGRTLRADENTHADLFWAIRGGGGNFGVATRLHFRLHPVDHVLGGMLTLPATPELVETFLAEVEAAPEELSGLVNVMAAPPMPFIPPEHHGRMVLAAVLVYAGELDAGERVFARLRSLAPAISDAVRPMRYPQVYEAEGPHPTAVAVRSLFIDGLDRTAAETVLGHLAKSSAPMRVTQFRVMGGAVARVPADATAFAHRQRRIMVNVAAAYERVDEAPEHDAWAAALADVLRADRPGAYVGFLADEGEARVREAYPGATWSRLQEIKRRYDPTNVFRLNQNVPPGGGSSA